MASLFNQLGSRTNYKWWVASVLFLGLLVTVADFGEVSVAMPSISDHFESDLAVVQWLAIGNFLAISVFLLPMSRFADKVGRKKILVVGFLIFSLGAGLAGIAPNLGTLIFLRVVQGIALGMIQGNQMAILMAIFPSEERGKILGFQMTLVGVGLIVGPVVGGLLTSWFGWRAIFYFNFPMGVICLLLIILVLDERRVSSVQDVNKIIQFDWIGAVISAATLIVFLIGLSNPFDWSLAYQLALLLTSAVLAGAFVLWETNYSSPMLDLRLFAQPLFTSSVISRIIIFLCVGPVIFLIPFYLQSVAGYTPGQAGIILMTNAIGLLVAGPIAGRLSDRYGWRIFTVGGSLASAMGLLILSALSQDTALPIIVIGILLPSIGNGMFSAPSSAAILSVVPGSSYGIISALIQLLRNTSMVTGIATATLITTLIMTNSGLDVNLGDITGEADPAAANAFVSAIRTVFLTMAGLQIIGAVLSLYKGVSVPETSH
ncbi:MFS transporter [SAR202 cluster bacterium AD-804-J14_MRT_500m]|nr:MFS transporter [SAR202 cluster bacterium AD-804-J14_MRT_500m]